MSGYTGHPQLVNQQSGDFVLEYNHLHQQQQRLSRAYIQNEQQLEQLTAEKTHDQEEIKSLREQCGVLERQNTKMRQELEDCKDDLFKLQPVSQIPDSVIAQQYDRLSSAIGDWVDDEVSRFTDAWQEINGDDPPEIFHHGNIDHLRDILRLYPDTGGEYVVRYVVSFVLHRELFHRRVLLFGLPLAECELLQRSARTMKLLEPKRDYKTIRAWKAETLTAIAASVEYKQDRTEATNKLGISLITTLASVLPGVVESEPSQKNLYQKIIEPAVDLAVKIQTSAAEYHFNPRIAKKGPAARRSITSSDIQDFKMVDIKSGKRLKMDSQVVPNNNGRIGDQILILTPALIRCQPGSMSVRLSQQAILVELDNPLGRRGRSIGIARDAGSDDPLA